MNIADLNKLGHEMAEQPSIYSDDRDFVCNKCNVRIAERSFPHKLILILNYVDGENIGTYSCIYNLSCEEQQIKNILE